MRTLLPWIHVQHLRQRARFLLLPLATFVAFFTVYAMTAATTVQGGDAGELATVANAGGLAHPPGYPLFMILGRIANTIIPFGSSAYKLSLLSALFAALALTLLVVTMRLLTQSRLAALLPVLSLGFSSTYWRYATVGEVFSLTALNAALIVLLSLLVIRGWRGWAAMFALGLSCALGIAHQYTVVLLFPLLVLALWKNFFSVSNRKRSLIELAVFVLATFLGFLPYLSLLQVKGGWHWGRINSLTELAAHFLRLDYGAFQLAAGTQSAANWHHLALFFSHELVDISAVSLFVLIALWRANQLKPRTWLMALGASVLLTGPGLLMLFNVPTSGLGFVVAERFYILPTLLVTVFAGLGLSKLRSLVYRQRYVDMLLIIFVILSLPLVRGSRPGHYGWTVLQDYIVNALKTSGPNAIVIGSSDSELGAYLYMQKVQHQGQNVLYIAPPMLGKDWYCEQLSQQRPALASALAPVSVALPQRLQQLIRTQLSFGPVYLALDHWQNQSLRTAFSKIIPVGGTLLQVLPNHASMPTLPELEHKLRSASENLQINSWPQSQQELMQSWEGDIFLNYARCWNVMADLYREAGQSKAERRCRIYAARWTQPWKTR